MTSPAKVLFLDVDGVLNSLEWFAVHRDASSEIDPRAVRRVERIIAKTGATVVLSSAWRLSSDSIVKVRRSGIPIADCTPYYSGEPRWVEIMSWLQDNPETLSYAILDDDGDAGVTTPDRFVQTNWVSGLTDMQADRVIAILNSRG